jgi:hypothetical protein
LNDFDRENGVRIVLLRQGHHLAKTDEVYVFYIRVGLTY